APRYALIRATINCHRCCPVSSITSLASTAGTQERADGQTRAGTPLGTRHCRRPQPLHIGHEQRHLCSAEDKSSSARRKRNQDRDVASGQSATAQISRL